jgi:hypothetical protein
MLVCVCVCVCWCVTVRKLSLSSLEARLRTRGQLKRVPSDKADHHPVNTCITRAVNGLS